ncbi:release factor glutamine methyltransferase [Pseudonocardia ammonioxydans]|uniref:peptide chain release factor N(5)-glutamine methyltransferase n=1 Tax=Pseudonocardia ammonioxydans TaxID=260086 RepID=A0A1I4UZ10_PSUAM|nr:putative protein N(5)-glutamine methyltransferase [Pseudonocardia ammonioxydans]SFM94267.1 release factor glutamine methyltransferase [Pseudonocardia ammonioxydans]
MSALRNDLVGRLRAAGCVFAEEEARLLGEAAADAPGDAVLDDLVRRRVAGEPLEHLLGWVAFDGHRVRVATGVFVPRRRSEALVHAAVAGLRPGAVVVDLCCGCGALGLAVARRVPVELHAADVDPVATACAATNLAGTGTVHTGDLFEALPPSLRGRVEVLLANTPYVPASAIADMPPEARDHEPRTALDGGGDGLDPARRVAAGAPAWLAPGGTVLIETSEVQAPVLADVFARHGLDPATGSDDDRAATWVTGRLPR